MTTIKESFRICFRFQSAWIGFYMWTDFETSPTVNGHCNVHKLFDHKLEVAAQKNIDCSGCKSVMSPDSRPYKEVWLHLFSFIISICLSFLNRSYC